MTVDEAAARAHPRRSQRTRQGGNPLRRPVADALQHRRQHLPGRAARRRRAARRGRRAGPGPLRRREPQLPLIARGAGTGVAGESLGTGLVVDLSRHFRTILDVGSRHRPRPARRRLPRPERAAGARRPALRPDPASGDQCTLGGMLANNASGARALRHGYTRDHVAALRVVLDTGDAVDGRPGTALARRRRPSPASCEDIVSSVGAPAGAARRR